MLTKLVLLSCLGLLLASADVQECPLSDLLFTVVACNPRSAKLREFVMQWPDTDLNTLPRDTRKEVKDMCDDFLACLAMVKCPKTQEHGAGIKKSCSMINLD